MIVAHDPVTLLRGNKPRRPIICSLCGRMLGAWWQYKTAFYPHMTRCTDECERLLEFSRDGSGVPRQWREYPEEWRAPLLAAALVEKNTHV